MAISKTEHVTIRGITVTLPKNKMSVFDLGKGNFDEEEIKTIAKGVGVESLYIAEETQTASDFCFNSAEKLMLELGWEKKSIDGLIFVSQTPDYIAPATAGILQDRLGLSMDCLTFDVNFGCTGFLNGLLLASQLIEVGTCKRVLVLVGDTLRRLSSALDKGIHFILSDAGSAIAVEYSENKNKMITTMHSDGSGFEGLMLPAGGARIPITKETGKVVEVEEGNKRSLENYCMNGMDIFSFAVKRVPRLINEIEDLMNWGKDEVDFYFLHQANAYMVNYITKRAKIDKAKCPININKYGNTNGTTIPLLLVDYFNSNKNVKPINAILCAFGVGLSWGATAVQLSDLYCSDIQYM